MGLEGEEEDAPERKGFWERVDLRLGVIEYKEMKVRMHENA